MLATSFDPDYDPNLTDHDAAILTLAQPITTAAAAPIDILDAPTESSFADPGDPVTVSGWGSTVKQDPDFSRRAELPARRSTPSRRRSSARRNATPTTAAGSRTA